MSTYALIACGGQGARAGLDIPKQYQKLVGQSVIAHTLDAFEKVQGISKTCVLISPNDRYFEDHVKLPSAAFFVAARAGSTRAETVLNGLKYLLEIGADASDWVLVHDAARCLITPHLIEKLMTACQNDAVGGILALKVADTIKSEQNGRIDSTVSRTDKWLAQTPQMFRIQPLIEALKAAGGAVTDEASAMEFVGAKALLVEGSAQNFKLTYPEDFALAKALLISRTSTP